MQYAFLVTSVVQFAGGVVVFFGLLTSPKEVGKDSEELLIYLKPNISHNPAWMFITLRHINLISSEYIYVCVCDLITAFLARPPNFVCLL